ncbi:MAG: EamA family transporter [[Actinobacillus] rossii]|nr:EamA family transporter [[Actinobacillus] rossii]MDY5792960.1 EamA family transporter [[Actinobacillus] rossii]
MIYLIIAVAIWASAFIFGKVSYQMVDPALTVQLRLLIAMLFSLPFFVPAYRRIPPHLMGRIWLLALINFPIVLLLQFIGLSFTSAASAVTMLGTEPLVVAFIGHFFFRQTAKLLDWILGLIAFIGIILVVLGGEKSGDVSLWGCLLVLAGSMAFGFTIYIGRDVIKEYDARDFTSVIIVLGALLCLPFTVFLVHDWTVHFSWLGMGAILYLGVGCTWLAYRLWNKGLLSTRPVAVSIINTLEPVFGVMLAVFFLGEHLTFITGLGMVLVIGAASASVLVPTLYSHLRKRV